MLVIDPFSRQKYSLVWNRFSITSGPITQQIEDHSCLSSCSSNPIRSHSANIVFVKVLWCMIISFRIVPQYLLIYVFRQGARVRLVDMVLVMNLENASVMMGMPGYSATAVQMATMVSQTVEVSGGEVVRM